MIVIMCLYEEKQVLSLSAGITLQSNQNLWELVACLIRMNLKFKLLK